MAAILTNAAQILLKRAGVSENFKPHVQEGVTMKQFDWFTVSNMMLTI